MTRHAVLLSVLACCFACARKEHASPAADPQLVARGAYIVHAAGCIVCHTAQGSNGPDFDHAFAGGRKLREKSKGRYVTPNITPDVKTGIGGWTDAQIAAAIREGVRPDGSHLYTLMPYASYNRMTDRDVEAVVAYLRSLKPVERAVPRNTDLKIAKTPVPKPANQPDPVDDPIKHGEYLASLMLCSHCHYTPGEGMEPAGSDKMFSGGLSIEPQWLGSGVLYTRNITSDRETGIGTWTEDQIYTVIKTMTKPDGKLIEGPMLFYLRGWSQLDDKDLHAVAAFIHALPPVSNKVPDSTFEIRPR